MADAYGLGSSEREIVVDCILERQLRNVRFWAEIMAASGQAVAGTEVIGTRIAWSRHEHASPRTIYRFLQGDRLIWPRGATLP